MRKHTYTIPKYTYEYIDDSSENEWSNGMQDTELYHRHPQEINTECYHMPRCYPNHQMIPRHYHEEDAANAPIYKNTSYIPANMKYFHYKDLYPNSAPIVKKHPITVRTPRYYRSFAPALDKRPSKLCLPLCTEPDPAVGRRKRRSTPRQPRPGCRIIFKAPKKLNETVYTPGISSGGDQKSVIDDRMELQQQQESMHNSIVEQRNADGDAFCVDKYIDKLYAQLTAKDDHFEEISSKENVEENVTSNEKCELETKDSNQTTYDAKEKNLKSETTTKLVDDNWMIDLYRSKNYVLALVDKAISRELGTIPNENCNSDQIKTDHTINAMDFINECSQLSKLTGKKSNQPSESLSSRCTKFVHTDSHPNIVKLKQLKSECLRRIHNEMMILKEIEAYTDLLESI